MKRSEKLRILAVQLDITWHNIDANISELHKIAHGHIGTTDLIVLPEMFTTGFSMEIEDLAEIPDGDTITKLQQISDDTDIAIMGSYVVNQHGNIYNREFLITPVRIPQYYDKRHLFSMGGEDEVMSAGYVRKTFHLYGWSILPVVCYDLRFPVWCRNVNNEYDLMVVVANWPQSRISAWDILVKARAIENLCYVVAVNRIGVDPHGLVYTGHSDIINAKGESLLNEQDKNDRLLYAEIEKSSLQKMRSKFPVWQDADSFKIEL
ncbi:nitrilase-related carbon-nitrogen hydrolase [Porphyromonas pogonae]|uniref:nitrilase-related carbon-nitrogen hydrolase n=1 Tax=Porphyromonas pogonae TaxID=867595 RepID=UPI002E7825B6|nr:nitrilase-related carbon-nitrogen hydrolase [Porphyromonas pogonae]